MALLSSSPATAHLSTLSHPSSSSKPNHLTHKPYLLLSLPLSKPKRTHLSISPIIRATIDNGAGVVTSSSPTIPEEKALETPSSGGPTKLENKEEAVGPTEVEELGVESVKKFQNPKWVNGTWDLKQFQKDGKPDWDAVIDAEAKRRKWLETYPESTSNDEPIVFDTSIIPWWAWIKRFHLPEAELLNGRAAMVGFFMAYFVDSLTGVGLVDQMGNFFCKTLLFVAVLGVLLVRKNEDVDNLKKLIEETTFYDKQWQATWQEETKATSKKD